MDMTDNTPLVTIMIATKDRADELRLTLGEIRKQRYSAMELLVIDDGSKESVGPVVLEAWPEATVVRHERSAGQCARRNQGFALANGEYILQLDDDCSFVGENDLAAAVRKLQAEQAGALSFYIVNSAILPAAIDTSRLKEGCVASFVGAAILFRKSAIAQTAGYRTFFLGEWEEEELSLQLLSRGHRIVFAPEIVAHHRLSLANRNSGRTWSRGVRNRIWALLIHMPLRRAGAEISWKVALGAWDAVRLQRPILFAKSLIQATTGVGRALRLRSPLAPTALRRYDALRLYPAISREEFEHPPAITFAALSGFWRRWRNRARNRSVWDRESGDVGESYTVAFAHERRLHSDKSSAETR